MATGRRATRTRLPAAELEWAAIWKQLPKVVFSTTLESVEGNARLVRGDAVAEVARLKAEPGEGALAVGGAGLAASLVRAGLVDEYGLFVFPVVLGAGTPFFPRSRTASRSTSSRRGRSARASSTSATRPGGMRPSAGRPVARRRRTVRSARRARRAGSAAPRTRRPSSR